MFRLRAALALLIVAAASDSALAHGGTQRGSDGVPTPRFDAPFGAPTIYPVRTPRHRHRLDLTHEWDWWWDNNCESLLATRARVAREAATSFSAESQRCFFGASEEDLAKTIARLTRSQIRRAALPALRRGMSDVYFDCRAAAVIGAGKAADPLLQEAAEVLAGMRKLLADADKGVRESACLGLGLLGDESQVPDLLSIMRDDAWGRELAGSGPAKSVLPRQGAFSALAIGLIGMKKDLDDAVVSELVRIVEKEENLDVRALAATALGVIRNRSSVPALRALATSPALDGVVRAHAIVTLAKLGDRELVEFLVKSGVADKSAHVQRSSAIALGLLLRPEDQAMLDVLVLHSKASADRSMRNLSFIALGRIGGAKAIDWLLDRLEKGQAHDQAFSALALGLAAGGAPGQKRVAGEALLRAWSRIRSDHTRGAFAIGLGLLGYEPAAPVLIEGLKGDAFVQLKGHIATALGLLGAVDALPLVRELATVPNDSATQQAARKALGLFGEPDDIARLVELVRQDGHDLSALGAAAAGLGFFQDRRPVASLAEMISSPDSHKDTSRAFAAVALGCLGDKDEVPLLASLRADCNYLASTDALLELLRIY